MTDLPARPIEELAHLLGVGELGAVELATACLDAIDQRESELQAWVRVDAESTLDQARRLDAVPAGARGPLHGIPVGVKDIIDTADLPTEYGSPIYAGHRPANDAEVVSRLRAAGAVIVGKTVTTEFALFKAGPTTNPHDSSRTPGGSSSGSAAAVGARTIPLALGTQTAGSIVRPASFCGVVGVKPTFGGIPTGGVKPCSQSLDTVGIFTGDVAGAAHVLPVLTGTSPVGVSERDPVRVGFARTPEWDRIPGPTQAILEQGAALVADELDVVEVDLPFAGLAEAQTVVMQVEATRALAVERERHAEQLSEILRNVLRIGDRMAWASQAARGFVDQCRARLPEIFAGVDVLLAPSVLGEAPPLAEGTGDPLLCRAWTALGTPAISVPGLTGPSGLPLGMQVIGAPGRDGTALAAAHRISRLLESNRAA